MARNFGLCDCVAGVTCAMAMFLTSCARLDSEKLPGEAPPLRYPVSIDCATQHQNIDNFGASDCWRMQKIGAWSDESKNRIADLLFSTTKGIGLSCWRFNLGGGLDYEHMGADSWRTVETFEVGEGEYDWSRQAEERWFLGAAKARGVDQFIAFYNGNSTFFRVIRVN